MKVSDDASVTEARRLRFPLTPSCPGRLPSISFHLRLWHTERRPKVLQKGSVSARAASEQHCERETIPGAPMFLMKTTMSGVRRW